MGILTGFLILLLMAGAAAGYSTLFLREKDFTSRGEYLIFTLGLGFGILVLITFIFSALHLISFYLFIAVTVTGMALLFREWRSFVPAKPVRKIPLFLLLILAFLLVNLFYSLFPPTFYDSMMYHLAVPNYYILHGGIVPWDTNFNASLPLNGEMLFLFSLLGGSVFTAKLISLFSGILIIALLTLWFRDKFGGKHRFLPALLFVTVPQISFLMSSSKTDIIGMFFLLLGIRSFFHYLEKRPETGFRTLSGIFWGLAVGTKYIFAFYLAGFFLALLFVPGFTFRHKVRTVWKISMLVLLCMAPWFLKNIVTTGNPVYPYLNKYIHHHSWDASQGDNFSKIIRRGEDRSISDFLMFPVNLLTKPYSYGITAVWGFMFLVFLLFGFFHGDRIRGRLLLLTSLFSFLMMIPFAMVPRYFLASLLLMVIPVSQGIGRGEQKIPVIRLLLTPVILLVAAVNLVLLAGLQEKFFHGLSYLTKKYSREYAGEKINYLYALPYYPGVEYINDHLSGHDLVAFLGEDRTFYMKIPFLASSFNDRNVILDTLRDTDSSSEFRMTLELKGISHIYFSPSGLDRMGRSSPVYRLGTALREKLESRLLDMTALYRDKHYILYRIRQY